MFGSRFLGKTRVPHHKDTACSVPVKMTSPSQILLPLSQSIGKPAVAVVKAGDEVKVGQVVGEADGRISAYVHSSVSGKVVGIENYVTPTGVNTLAVRIESDGLMTPFEGLTPPVVEDFDSFIEAVRVSGLVGLGGAGFPTSEKLNAARDGKIHTVVINGAECEPYLTCDSTTMRNRSAFIGEGIALLEKFLVGVNEFVFGIEKNKPECIAEMERVFAGNEKVRIVPLPVMYPQGAEKVTVYNTTGIVVPEGKYPSDVGVIVINVSTLATLAEYMKTGMPLVARCVTVDGAAIKNPMNVITPIGALASEVIEFTGGFKEGVEVGKIIYGGPMMGVCISNPDEPVIKLTNGLTVLTVEQSHAPEYTACIRCGRCVEACPLGLEPLAFTKALKLSTLEERICAFEENSLNLCMDCGCCSYVCPAHRPLAENNRLAKNVYRAHKASLSQKK